MLEAVPNNFFCNSFLLTDAEKLVGEVDTSLFMEKASLELEDGSYQLFREGWWKAEFLMVRGGNVVARATKPGLFQNRLEVQLADRTFVLRKPSSFSRRFEVFEGGEQIGSIYPLSWFSRRSQIDLPSQLPIALRGFLFWLVMLMWKRQQAATA